MLTRISKRIVRFLNENGQMDTEQQEICLYGTEVALYTVISTLGLLFVGGTIGMLKESFIIIAVYYTNQTVGGGFHCSTHWRCFLTMAIGLTVTLLTYLLPDLQHAYLFLTIVSISILWIRPLILHHNKEYLEPKRKQLTIISRRTTIAMIILLVTVYATSFNIQAFCLGIISSAISRLAAIRNKETT